MGTLIVTIFIASLVGSLHCAGMCGGLLALAMDPRGEPVSKARLQVMYHAGRGVAYMAIGSLAGFLGRSIDVTGNLAGIQRASAAAAGAALATFGVMQMLKVIGRPLPRLPLPRAWQALIGRGYGQAASQSPSLAALLIGLLTPLLPCGWLYAFAFAAAGTADPVTGGIAMLMFWIGTLPMMITLGVGVQTLLGSASRTAPMAASLAMIAIGVMTAAGRVLSPLPAALHSSSTVNAGSCAAFSMPIEIRDRSKKETP
jgi:sulfite exporter TauE/SafE